jgi:predicted ATPase
MIRLRPIWVKKVPIGEVQVSANGLLFGPQKLIGVPDRASQTGGQDSVTYRPEFTSSWVGRPHVTLLTLNRLLARRCAEVIARVTGGKALPTEVTNQIIDRTDGVRLFIEELTKAVVESGVVTDAGDRYTVAGPLPPLAIPTSLNASLLARLDRLAPVRDVAQMAAALGRSFSYELISAVDAASKTGRRSHPTGARRVDLPARYPP